MSQLLVRDIDQDTTERLQRRASEHGRTMEDEARDIIERAVGPRRATVESEAPEYGWASGFVASLCGRGLTDEEAANIELRGQEARPAEFE